MLHVGYPYPTYSESRHVNRTPLDCRWIGRKDALNCTIYQQNLGDAVRFRRIVSQVVLGWYLDKLHCPPEKDMRLRLV